MVISLATNKINRKRVAVYNNRQQEQQQQQQNKKKKRETIKSRKYITNYK